MPHLPEAGVARVALLRAVNLGSHLKLSMADLRDLLANLGFTDPRTLLQTGNVVFGSRRSPARLETELEAALADRLGLETDVVVRTVADFHEVQAANPFPDAARNDPAHLVVYFLKKAPDEGAVETLREAIRDRETVEAAGPHLYAVYPDGIGRSRLTTRLIEAKLGTRGTGRNWNTVTKLAALLKDRRDG